MSRTVRNHEYPGICRSGCARVIQTPERDRSGILPALPGAIAGCFILAFLLAVPAMAATDGKIAFCSNRGGDPDIYTMDPNGTGVEIMTTDTGSDSLPDWCPNGTKIAFVSNRDDSSTFEVYAMNADGSNQTRLTANAENDWAPAWSPDGTRIAFYSDRDGTGEIYVMNANGSNQTRLTNNTYSDADPDWSPDGTKIAFSSHREDDNWDIFVMDADGRNEARLTTNGTADFAPAWSPDGAKIAFHSFRDMDYEIYVMNADGSDQARLTNASGVDADPAWSPDGTKIIFDSARDTNREIYVMDADGSNQTRLTVDGSTDTHPAWYGVALSGIKPKSGKRGTIVTIKSISGLGFAPGAKAALVKGSKSIRGKAAAVMNPTLMKCKFRIPAAAKAGKWSVRVTNPDAVSGILAKAFTVK